MSLITDKLLITIIYHNLSIKVQCFKAGELTTIEQFTTDRRTEGQQIDESSHSVYRRIEHSVRMHSGVLCLSLVCCLGFVAQTQGAFARFGSFSVPKPGTIGWYVDPAATDVKDRYHLLVDTYSNLLATNDNSYVFQKVGNFLRNPGALTRLQIGNGFKYPRNIAQTPGRWIICRMFCYNFWTSDTVSFLKLAE